MSCEHELTFVQVLKKREKRTFRQWLVGESDCYMSVAWLCRKCGKGLVPKFEEVAA